MMENLFGMNSTVMGAQHPLQAFQSVHQYPNPHSHHQHQHQHQQQQLQHQSQQPHERPNSSTMVANQTMVQQQQPQQHQQQQQQQQQLIQIHQSPSMVTETIPTSQLQSNNELISYYFGSISRETAEWILKNHGNNVDGAYLLRSSGPNDDFVLSIAVQTCKQASTTVEVLHYRIVETEDSFVALHGQMGDEKFATIEELIEKAQGVATKPRWPISRQSLESHILPPTYWGLTVDQVRSAIVIRAKQWGFSSFSAPTVSQAQVRTQPAQPTQFEQANSAAQTLKQQSVGELGDGSMVGEQPASINTLSNETIRTLIHKSLHEFQPWFHGQISREEAERRIESAGANDGRFLVRERDNLSYALCLSHKKTTKHYRIDVLSTGELAIQDGRKFTSLMALVSHYTIMSDGLWCALTEACPRPIQPMTTLTGPNSTIQSGLVPNPAYGCQQPLFGLPASNNQKNIYQMPPVGNAIQHPINLLPCLPSSTNTESTASLAKREKSAGNCAGGQQAIGAVQSIKAPMKEWLHSFNNKLNQLMASKNQQSLNSFLFGNQNPLNRHCNRHHSSRSQRQHMNRYHTQAGRKCKNGHQACGCLQIDSSIRLANQQVCKVQASNCFAKPDGRLTHLSCDCCTQLATLGRPDTGQSAQGSALGCLAQTGRTLDQQAQIVWLNRNHQFNGQSFVGSPLFAVDTIKRAPTANQNGGAASSSSNSNSDGSGSRGDQNFAKLISPAQSVTADLCQSQSNVFHPYMLNTEIYGSQASTELAHDRLPSSSSSSGSQRARLMNERMSVRPANQPTKRANSFQANHTLTHMPNLNHLGRSATLAPKVQGRYEGPAFRYTNCPIEDRASNTVAYNHTLATPFRAIDDSHLLSSNSHFVGPAAMGKFVQFQDGHCLRTHRDTRSIQMAYLLSRQAMNQRQDGNQPGRANLSSAAQSLATAQAQSISQPQTNQQSQWSNHLNNIHGTQSGMRLPANLEGQNVFKQGRSDQQLMGNLCDEFDLINCDADGINFDFKYDPKLIKSSSIDTLCGGDDGLVEEKLDQSASNRELLMTLQPLWYPHQFGNSPNILKPVQTSENSSHQMQTHAGAESENNTTLTGCESFFSPANLEDPNQNELENVRSKHDLDELTTALLVELSDSLKAQVELKKRQSGLISQDNTKGSNGDRDLITGRQSDQQQTAGDHGDGGFGANPLELIHEFDILVTNKGHS